MTKNGKSWKPLLPELPTGQKGRPVSVLISSASCHEVGRGIEMVAPHKKNRKRPATQDGRLRRYKRRFKVQRFFSWCEDFRRLVVRWEYHAEKLFRFCAAGMSTDVPAILT